MPKSATITDSTAVNVTELARHMNISRTVIYRCVNDGYIFEFAVIGKTTPGHFKEWLRKESITPRVTQGDQERQERELRRLRSTSGKCDARRPSRGSRTAVPEARESSRSPQPA